MDKIDSINNYIFDFYLTLVDIKTDEQAAQTWKKWLRTLDKRGLKHPVYYQFRRDFFAADRRHRVELKKQTGCDVPEIDIINVYRELFEKYGNGILGDELLNEISYEFRVASRAYIRPYPGVIEYLKKLRGNGHKVFILSNAQRSYTWPEIKMFGFDEVTDDQLISSDYGAMKPDVRFFNALIQKHNLKPEECLMHGDTIKSDIEGAKAAGMHYVHLIGENAPEQYYLRRLNRTMI